MKKEKILKSKGYNITKIQNELFRELTEFMEKENMNRTQFAKHLGVTKGYVSQVLNGDFDYKLSKLVELSLAMGKIPQLTFSKVEDLIESNEMPGKVINLSERKYGFSSSKNVNNRIPFEENEMQEFKIAR